MFKTRNLLMHTLMGVCALHASQQKSEIKPSIQLVLACKQNDVEQVKKIFKTYSVIEIAEGPQKTSCGWTAAHYAALRNKVKILKLLQVYQIDLEQKDILARTPLILACEKGNIEAVQFFIDILPFPLAQEGGASLIYLTKLAEIRAENCPKISKKKLNNYKRIIELLEKKLNEIGTAFLSNNDLSNVSLVISNGATEPTLPSALKKKKQILDENLLKAAKDGNIQKIKKLIKKGANLFTRDSNNNSIIHLAAACTKNAKTLNFLLSRNQLSTACGNRFDRSILAIAAGKGNSAAIKRILQEETANDLLYRKELNGELPIHHAVRAGSMACVDALLNKAPDTITTKNNKGLTPFLLAIHMRNQLLVTYFLKHRSGFISKQHLKEALYLALKRDDPYSTSLLLSQAENISSPMDYKKIEEMVLKQAAALGALACLSFYVGTEPGAWTTILTLDQLLGLEKIARKKHRCAAADFLKEACYETKRLVDGIKNKDVNAVKNAIAHGAYIECDYQKQSLLTHAVTKDFVEGVKLLVAAGAQVNPLHGSAPLDQAFKQRDLNNSIIDILLAHGAAITYPKTNKPSPWSYFLQRGDAKTVEIFEKYNLIHNHLHPAQSLLLSVGAENLPVTQALLKAKFDVNCTEKEFLLTPLHLVTSCQMARLLISHGALKGRPNRSGKKPIDIVKNRFPDNLELLKLLEI